MGNLITSERVPGTPGLKMSNARTSVFLDVLVLAAVLHARTNWELQLAYWLVEHDQDRIGLGCVGFDVFELGWSEELFDEQRRFLLRTVDAALSCEGWERLPYEPSEEILFPLLRTFRELIEGFSREAIHPKPNPETEWVPSDLPTHGSCEVHEVFLHEVGCILCNRAPIDDPPEETPHRTPPRTRPA